MERLQLYLSQNWLGLAVLGCALACGATALVRSRRPSGFLGWVVLAGALGVSALGGLLPSKTLRLDVLDLNSSWAVLVLVSVGVAFFLMFLVLFVSGSWSAPLAWVVAACFLLGIGNLAFEPIGEGLREAALALRRMEALQPWWLLLLLLIPVIVRVSYRSLAGLGPVRRWVAIGLRSSLILLLTLALAEVRIRHANENLTVLFLLDVSLSVPADIGKTSGGVDTDLRMDRIKRFINDAVQMRGNNYLRDSSGVIVFGKKPRLELPPANVPKLNFNEIISTVDSTYTDIGAAIKLALASFPENTSRRIVLISDGNENLGNAEDQARLAKSNGVQIDVLPLAIGDKRENEVLVERVEAPPMTEQGAQLPIRVLIRSWNPNIIEGKLRLDQIALGMPEDVEDRTVQVRPGLNAFSFKKALAEEKQSYSYKASFTPRRILDNEGGEIAAGLPGDRVQNNVATTHVVATGQRLILLVETKSDDHQLLVKRLRNLGKEGKFRVHSTVADKLPKDPAELGLYLSSYDCVLLANVAAGELNPDQQEMIRSNTENQGCGLIMIGGPDSFGAGGWQDTPVEKALPVDCDIKSFKVEGKGGLVLYMHASEIAEGNRWQKEVAKLAIRKLSLSDMVGVMYYSYGPQNGHTWHVPFQQIGEKRDAIMRQVDKMQPGDMPDVDPALNMVLKELNNPAYELAKKHMIFISDGDHWTADPKLLARMKASKITCSTVCITSHGQAEEIKMADMAKATGGTAHAPKSPKALPAIYMKEARIVSQSHMFQKRFSPKLLYREGPTAMLPERVDDLYGYVRTTAKNAQNVQKSIMAPPVGDQEFPILAYWHYGLGKSVAFTSDATAREAGEEPPGGDEEEVKRLPAWDRDWAKSGYYSKFWEQVVGWALRAVETGKLVMTTEVRDGKVKVIIDARDDQNRPLNNLRLRGKFTPPSSVNVTDPKKLELTFTQTNIGVYEAQFKAEEAGSYFINVQQFDDEGKGFVDGVRAGVTIPYSPEFSDMESNLGLLERIRDITGGKTYEENAATLEQAAKAGDVYRRDGLPRSRSLQPIWHWLLLLTGTFLFFDVAVRRIALEPAPAIAAGQRLWSRLRGQAVAEATPAFIDRLKSRKAAIDESLEKQRAARRFDAGDAPSATAPAGADEEVARPDAPRAAPRAPTSRIAPEAEKQPEDYASRLMKAKKKVWQERKDQDKKEP